MSEKHFTDEQLAAIEAYGSNIIVSAGAGSGKTDVLSNKVKDVFLNHDLLPSNILVLTFTNSAAFEMKNRIIGTLKSDNNIKKEFIDQINTSHVQTFDSFTLFVFKKFSYLLNLNSNISIINPIDLKIKKDEILDKIIQEKIDSNDETFIKYFKDQYRASNIVISVAGKMDCDRVFELLEKGFGKLADYPVDRKIDNSYTINAGENKIVRDTNQVHLCFNTKGVSLVDEKKYPAAIISSVLGGNMSSRLFQKIREERGLAYSVYTYSSAFLEGGVFTVYAGTTHESYRDVIEIIKAEFEDIRENGITAYELQKSKNQFLSMLTFSLEGSKGKMNRMANSYLLYGEVIDIDTIINSIEKITLEDIKETAKIMFDEKYYSWTILGNV